jgi:serine/threonine protein kinase
VKQLKKNAAGLGNAKIEDFTILGVAAEVSPVRYINAEHKKRSYTLKVLSKKQVVGHSLQTRLRNEMRLLTAMNGHKRFIPLPLQTIEDDSYIYMVLQTK